HAQLRNAVERIFGVLKRRFRILSNPPEIDLRMQARIPAALAALHNFIRIHDPDEINDFYDAEDENDGIYGELARGPANRAEKTRGDLYRDTVAEAMWQSYQ
ncbi:hypothetical protein SISSUDRAFT_956594, partial [Sistotremastrum suecicum HHB10207 ss-3]